MSAAEYLRRAAAQMYGDAAHLGDHVDSFIPAVADLLGALAHDRELDPYLAKHFDEAALAVARAYLGDKAGDA